VTALTFSLAEAAAQIPCKEKWLADQLRAGVGRTVQHDKRSSAVR
jgi:hypothetical protein